MTGELRAVLAEDNYLVREGTRRLLEASGQVDVLAAVGTADELIDAVGRLAPDVVVTDIRMPPDHRTEGIRAARLIRSRWPSTGVVVLSQYADPAYALELLGDGTAGFAYLLKDRIADYEQLVHAMREVAAGRSVLDPEIVDGLVRRRARSSSSPVSRLTGRELDVLRAMAEGLSNPAVGERLHLSVSAVEKHVNAIFTKLGLAPESQVHRRVVAVVTYLRATDATVNFRSEAE